MILPLAGIIPCRCPSHTHTGATFAIARKLTIGKSSSLGRDVSIWRLMHKRSRQNMNELQLTSYHCHFSKQKTDNSTNSLFKDYKSEASTLGIQFFTKKRSTMSRILMSFQSVLLKSCSNGQYKRFSSYCLGHLCMWKECKLVLKLKQGNWDCHKKDRNK